MKAKGKLFLKRISLKHVGYKGLEFLHDGLGLFLGQVGVENVQDLVLFGGLSHE